MYLILIELKDGVKTKERINKHHSWIKKNYDNGYFLIAGPLVDKKSSGMIIADIDSIQEINSIISQDEFYPNDANYEVHKMKANFIASNL
ncbi:YciI family protein [Fructobacillus tropaeoli]|uniref:Contains active-site pHis (YciI) n=1 Tax=Fructobacillus tropaeoli TaxID=709323 RepID=A0ABM9N1X7_9LACO|nr:YciI superfamily enzyme [Fructobacillus tropaeoli]